MIKTRKELINAYLEFFKSKKHAIIRNASLVPEHDPTVLFTTAGMHPLVPFLLGQKHPQGKRLCNVQKCIRTQDIESIGDEMHLTFFEMLGNWSLGDYWKKEAISWSLEFLTKHLGFDKDKICVTVFSGDKDVERDDESAKIWLSLGISKERIFFLQKEDNFWGPAGITGPCGPCTEMFIDNGKEKCSEECKPGCSCGKYFEVWNDVFMEYNKTEKKAILVDAINTLIDKEKGLNKELAEILQIIEKKIRVVTNAQIEEIKSKLNNYDFEIFTLLKNPDKSNPEYFKKLLMKYGLKSEEVIYFDHKEDNIKSAKEVGINCVLYKNNKQIKEFIEKNIGGYEKLKQRNVDTGMGVERTIAMLQEKKSVYEIEVFLPIIQKVKELSKAYDEKSARIIVDHLKAATFILAEQIVPSNLDRGYVLRRLIRRAIRYANKIGMEKNFCSEIAKIVIGLYKEDYQELDKNSKFIFDEITKEEERFRKILKKGVNISLTILNSKIPISEEKYENIMENSNRSEIFRDMYRKEKEKKDISKLLAEFKITKKELDDATISGKEAFLLFQSYGLPLEMLLGIAQQRNLFIDIESFKKEFEKHQELSRKSTEKRFKSGLADTTEETTKLHTATHLLHQALRDVLGKHVMQKGSNITAERLRFDFSHDKKMSEEEIKKVEAIVNEKIKSALSVARQEIAIEEAKKQGAIALFEAKYGEKVSVYSIGNYSKEVCAGPHVNNTKELGRFRITKEEAIAAGVRRIKAMLE